MAQFENKEDFIKRTKVNLQTIQEEIDSRQKRGEFYEVTHMLNYCLGLVVYPTELLKEKKLKITNKEQYKFCEMPYGKILLCLDNSWKNTIKFDCVLRHMRNSICHRQIATNTNGKYITELHFYDYDRKKGNERRTANFHMVMSIKQLPLFANEVINFYEKKSGKKINK